MAPQEMQGPGRVITFIAPGRGSLAVFWCAGPGPPKLQKVSSPLTRFPPCPRYSVGGANFDRAPDQSLAMNREASRATRREMFVSAFPGPSPPRVLEGSPRGAGESPQAGRPPTGDP